MRKFTKAISKKISNRFKYSRNRTSAVQNENVDHQGAPSNQNIEDISHPDPPTNDKHPTAEIPAAASTKVYPGSQLQRF
ncbi:hypothetical protein BDR07DRAFT_898179 [Suillus spraguei]|nr:hypothetical protein BDR07DRAFT_898179 [Suillus spraguei]